MGVQISRQNQFEYDVVRSRRQTKTESRFDVQRAVVIDHSIHLMGLVSPLIEVTQRAKIVVLLSSGRPARFEVVRNPRSGCEIKVLEPVVCRIENRVDDDVDETQVPPEDRADLRREPRRIPPLRVVAELEVRAVEKP